MFKVQIGRFAHPELRSIVRALCVLLRSRVASAQFIWKAQTMERAVVELTSLYVPLKL